MPTDPIRAHLQAALKAVVVEEKQRLHEHYDRNDAIMAERVRMLHPLLELIRALQEELQSIPSITISIAPHRHMATINLKGAAADHALSVATDYGNAAFQVEEHVFYSFDGESTERTHTFSNAEDAIRFLVAEVGKHIASLEVLRERNA